MLCQRVYVENPEGGRSVDNDIVRLEELWKYLAFQVHIPIKKPLKKRPRGAGRFAEPFSSSSYSRARLVRFRYV